MFRALLMSAPAHFRLLERMLLGHRVRRAQRVWVISSVSMAETGHLCLEVAGFPGKPILIELPPAFDPLSSAHIAWLLALIEHTLIEEFTPALTEASSAAERA